MSGVTITGGVGAVVGGSTTLANLPPGPDPFLHVAAGTLAYTGFAVGFYLFVALSLMVVGLALTRLGARSAKRTRHIDPPA